MSNTKKRIVILAEGKLDPFTAKTAAGVIRYRREEVIGVLAPSHAGRNIEEFLGTGSGVPIISSLDDVDDPDTLIIGIATPGGVMPDEWREYLREALRRGMEIVNGLHTFLSEDPELRELAAKHSATITDVRRPPNDLKVGMGAAASIDSKIILTVGSDCNIGKKIAAIEMNNEARKRGLDSVFVPTGQTGVMIEGRGIAIDRVISDFAAGAAERLVLEQKHREWIFVEGQGALLHPSYSGVTLSLMHGSMPGAMILCHQPTREFVRHTDFAIPSLRFLIELHESVMSPFRESQVVGISLNCLDMSPEDAAKEIERVESEFGLPTTDVIRYGASKLVDALEVFFQ
ncbi:MAG: DUF1611 domain-containing protein [Planctomycetota bacterium]|nr:DUF1611 domain-containing protein [Planctomycetota bacterium]MDA1137305.1 DUF1611 domain-containing protein [Planctomycetota bacterium]